MAKRTSYLQGFWLYPLCMAGHIGQGAVAAAAIVHGTTPGMVAGSVWTALYIAYQGLSVLRKEDSPGLDIADYMTGFGIGVGLAVLWGLV